MFRKMPFILLAIILSTTLFSSWIPLSLQSILYGVSLTIKSFIVFVLPFVVFGLLFRTAVHFSNKASKMIGIILIVVCCSNFFSTMLSYGVGNLAYQLDLSIRFPDEGTGLMAGWHFLFPKWIDNSFAMLLGLILGITTSSFRPKLAVFVSSELDRIIQYILKSILFLIPLFITGFVIKMNHDQVMHYIFSHYSLIFGLIASALFIYIGLAYYFLNSCNRHLALQSLKNMLPAGIAAFGSMSSAAAMPLTILGAEKNAKDPACARSVIPATVNIHLIGDCFAIPIFAFAVMKGFGMDSPSFWNYLMFSFYFVLAKFSVAAVPGGGILVMLPILETYLGFNTEMLSLITALYILFDPIITCANVFGNGGFSMLAERLFEKVSEKPAALHSSHA